MNTFNNRGRTANARSVEFLRAFVSEYNQTIHTHSEMMLEYNRNVSNIIRILQRTQDMAPPPTPASTPVARTSNRSDIATLIYLLSQANTEVRLTPAQILSATQIITYTPGSFNETQCPISLEEFIENEPVCQIRHCRHIFHRRNLRRWFDTHTCCPVCRHDLREDAEENNENENNENENNANTRVSSVLSSLFDSDVSGNGVYSFEFPIRFR